VHTTVHTHIWHVLWRYTSCVGLLCIDILVAEHAEVRYLGYHLVIGWVGVKCGCIKVRVIFTIWIGVNYIGWMHLLWKVIVVHIRGILGVVLIRVLIEWICGLEHFSVIRLIKIIRWIHHCIIKLHIIMDICRVVINIWNWVVIFAVFIIIKICMSIVFYCVFIISII